VNEIGSLLVERGVIHQRDLDDALRLQSVYGGRIGTCLLDLGYLVVEELAAYLSDHCDVPLPPEEWVEQPDPKALAMVPTSLVRRIQVLPLKLEKSSLHVAMIDPSNEEHRSFLEIASSREIVPYVLPEKRMVGLLERHLGIDRSPRFVGMISRPRVAGLQADEAAAATPLARARRRIRTSLDDASTDGGAPDPAAQRAQDPAAQPGSDPAALASSDEAAEDEIILLDELVAEPTDELVWEMPEDAVSDASSSDVPFSARIAHLEARLHGCRERDDIVRLALALASSFARVAGLFVVRSNRVTGFRASTPEMTASMSEIELPIEAPSMLTHPALSRMPYRGTPPGDGIDGRLLASLDRHDVREVFVHPIIIRDRTVNVLYADNGGDAFGETSIAALTALCDGLAGAYERLLMASRKTD
jgi:hypothetical protein